MSSEKILLVVTGTMYIFASSSLVLRPENEYHKGVLVILLK
jgi:hypothetical protein